MLRSVSDPPDCVEENGNLTQIFRDSACFIGSVRGRTVAKKKYFSSVKRCILQLLFFKFTRTF